MGMIVVILQKNSYPISRLCTFFSTIITIVKPYDLAQNLLFIITSVH